MTRRDEGKVGDAPRIAVIVPTYEARSHLPDCLDSLAAQVGVSADIIVSDNASSDGTARWVRKRYPQVRVLENGDNLGFSGAVNRGLEAAGDTEFTALINPDTRTAPDALKRLVEALKRRPEAGIAAARMVRLGAPHLVDNLGTAVTSSFGQVSIGSDRPPLPGFDDERLVPAACGGGMMITAAALRALGPFDEAYFLCWEDVEYSLRAFRQGFRCVYAPEAVIEHDATSIMGRWSKVNVFHYSRGALPTAVKLLPPGLLLALLPRILLGRMALAARFTGGGRLGSALRGGASGVALALTMMKRRVTLPPAAPGHSMRELLREGDRLRRIMKNTAPLAKKPEMGNGSGTECDDPGDRDRKRVEQQGSGRISGESRGVS